VSHGLSCSSNIQYGHSINDVQKKRKQCSVFRFEGLKMHSFPFWKTGTAVLFQTFSEGALGVTVSVQFISKQVCRMYQFAW
jgi:hypothetical protein